MNGDWTQNANGDRVGLATVDMRPDAACKRLRECQSRQEACEAIREIVSNLLGCEEMAVFRLDPHRRLFSLMWSFGIDAKAFDVRDPFMEAALPRVIAGEPYIHAVLPSTATVKRTATVSAVVPIKFEGCTAGALALFRLLPQKTTIDELDHGVFAVVSREAGEPLFGAASCGTASGDRKQP